MPSVLSIPQRAVTESESDRRIGQIEAAQRSYEWTPGNGLPPRCTHIPFSEKLITPSTRFYVAVTAGFFKGVAGITRNLLTSTLRWPTYDEFGIYQRLFHQWGAEIPVEWRRWSTDEEFCNAVLNGLQPEYLYRADPASSAVKADADLQDFVRRSERLPAGPNPSIKDLFEKKKLFVLNFRTLLRDAPPLVDGQDVVTSPIAGFYVDESSGQLAPLAIQLTPHGPLFHPHMQNTTLWLGAKLHVNRAFSAVHLPRDHFLAAHQLGEVFYVAARRNLSPSHPVLALLLPHFQGHLFANEFMRSQPPFHTPTAQHVMKVEWKRTRAATKGPDTVFATFGFLESLKARGMDDSAALPGYVFRDDGKLVWDAVLEYTREVVRCSYANDSEVAADDEIQGWIAEAGSTKAGGITGIPSCTTRKALAHVIAWIVFNMSAYHHYAAAAGQVYYGFVPTNPTTFNWNPPRTESQLLRSRATLKELRAALPSVSAAIKQSSDIAAIAGNWANPLLSINPSVLANLEGSSEGAAAVVQFRDRLRKVEAEIQRRTAARGGRFGFWLPSKAAASVWS